MRTFHQFDPVMSAIFIFRSRIGTDPELEQVLRKELSGAQGINIEFTSGDDWRVLELSRDIPAAQEKQHQVSPDSYRSSLDEMNRSMEIVKGLIGRYLVDGGRISVSTVFTCGTRDFAWLKNYSDITYLYKEKAGSLGSEAMKGEIYQTNIAYLTRILGFKGKILVNSLRQNGIAGLLYLLDRSSDAASSDQCLLIELDMDHLSSVEVYNDPEVTVKPKSPYSNGDEAEKEPLVRAENYRATIAGIKTKILDILITDSTLEEMATKEIAALKEKGNGLLDEISKIQVSINEHMKGYAPGTNYQGSKSDKKIYQREKELLTDASIHFSMVSEVENDIIRMYGQMRAMEDRFKERSTSLALTYDPHSTDEDRITFSETASRRIASETASLKDLSDRLTHSRLILTSTIEVLRTFLETRQREVSEKMNRLINLLFLVFACFGLADALGNFVIVILEHGYLGSDPSLGRVFEVTSLGMILTLAPLLVSAFLLYLYFQRR